MKYWVLYNYDYCENGGHGWESFDTKVGAEEFILECVHYCPKGYDPNHYTVLKATECPVKAIEVTTKVKIDG